VLIKVIGIHRGLPLDRYVLNDRNPELRLIAGVSPLICLRGFARYGVAMVALTQGSALPSSAQHCQAADVAAGHLAGSAVLTRPSLAYLEDVADVAAGATVVAVGVPIDTPVSIAAECGAGLSALLPTGGAATDGDHARRQSIARALVAALTAVGHI
jgi:hypothetical protein